MADDDYVTANEIVRGHRRARLVCGPADREVEAASSVDSRRRSRREGCSSRSPGERVDGNDFAVGATRGPGAARRRRDARARRRAARSPRGHAWLPAVLAIDDAEAFLQSLAAWWRDQLDCRGGGRHRAQSGKTTTKDDVSPPCSRPRSRPMRPEGQLQQPHRRAPHRARVPARRRGACRRDGHGPPRARSRALAHMARPHIGVSSPTSAWPTSVMLGSRLQHRAGEGRACRGAAWRRAARSATPCAPCCGARTTSPAGSRTRSPRRAASARSRSAQPKTDDARCTAYSFDETGCATGEATLPSGAVVELALGMPGEHNLIDALAAAGVGDVLGVLQGAHRGRARRDAPDQDAPAGAAKRPAASP